MTNKNDKSNQNNKNNKKKINCELQTSAPRKTGRRGNKNVNPSSVSPYAPGLFAARLLHRCFGAAVDGVAKSAAPSARCGANRRACACAMSPRWARSVSSRLCNTEGGDSWWAAAPGRSRCCRNSTVRICRQSRCTRSGKRGASGPSLPLIPPPLPRRRPSTVKIAEATAGARLAI